VGGCLGVGGVERSGREHGGDSAGGVACAYSCGDNNKAQQTSFFAMIIMIIVT